MDSQKVDMFLMTSAKFFPESQIGVIRDRLLSLDDSRWPMIQAIQYKDPTTALILSLVLGGYGADRFYIGQIGLGVAKLLTCGGLGIWAIIDWFLIMGTTREQNMERLMTAMSM